MKLLFCLNCQDVVRLQETKRTCKCGETSGRYIDELNAVYNGLNAVPLGFNNYSLALALQQVPSSGVGKEFTAFIIPRDCNTFKFTTLEDIEDN